MAFYDLSKEERAMLVKSMHSVMVTGIKNNSLKKVKIYFSDNDTYIRKSAYINLGRIYLSMSESRENIIEALEALFGDLDFKVRQTVVNAAGEIGITDFLQVKHFFDAGLFDAHHSVRNAVIGSIKKMGQKNPVPVLKWAQGYLHHPEPEIRREICHGIELRGRTHPEDILPMLRELQFDAKARVSNTLVHVLGQISYKKGCLSIVIRHLNGWENEPLEKKAIGEIIDVHDRYKDFSILTQKQAIDFINKEWRGNKIPGSNT
ncbi:MAG TPA: HEAT repeat domain-containing protein [Bacteroidia bacterium]|nr:HEAT repeat domain-containing protein [Bacteroidia bacterium]